MRRADLDQFHPGVADVEPEPPAERARGQHLLDALEPERAEEVAEQVADLSFCCGHRRQGGRRHLGHLVAGGVGGDDLDAAIQLRVAVAVVAVGVRVDRSADR